MSTKDNVVTIGGEPRIDFLPPEIRQKKVARRAQRGLIMLAVAVLVLCIVAYVGVTTLTVAAQMRLTAEQERTQELLREQQEYSSVRLLQQSVLAAKDARIVASGSELMWKPIMDAVDGTLPSNLGLMEVTIDSYSVGEAPPSSDGMLGPQQATIEMKVLFDRVSTVADWIDALKTLPQVSNLTFGGATLNDAFVYESVVKLHISPDALERRYFETPVAPDETEEAGE